ncbi:hypothetical protein E2C01_095248 [Portunus trituberculatus]|uniref:Uncharacterized protein n=1 Tax=Portunus trituberculatus TaxID=210409 RepID=A0A5B7K3Q1_PORTR|nr:hypothetical protein [Portunus trituberculatus]
MLAQSAAELEGEWNLRWDLQSCVLFVKSSAKFLWQSHWDNVHLHTIKPILGEWASSNRLARREVVVLACLRMNCTLPTHILSYTAKTFPPQCSTCNVTLSLSCTSCFIVCVIVRKGGPWRHIAVVVASR